MQYDNGDQEFYSIFFRKYPEATACARKIREYVKNRIGYMVSDDELMYLAIHIERIVRRDQTNE